MVAHNGSGFDNHIVLNSLSSSYKCIKEIRTSRRFLKFCNRKRYGSPGINEVRLFKNSNTGVIKKQTKRSQFSTRFNKR